MRSTCTVTHEWLITEKYIINLYRMTTKALALKE